MDCAVFGAGPRPPAGTDAVAVKLHRAGRGSPDCTWSVWLAQVRETSMRLADFGVVGDHFLRERHAPPSVRSP